MKSFFLVILLIFSVACVCGVIVFLLVKIFENVLNLIAVCGDDHEIESMDVVVNKKTKKVESDNKIVLPF